MAPGKPPALVGRLVAPVRRHVRPLQVPGTPGPQETVVGLVVWATVVRVLGRATCLVASLFFYLPRAKALGR